MIEGRDVGSPLTADMLRPSSTGRGTDQFSSLLDDEDFRRLADWLRQHPEMSLRATALFGSLRKKAAAEALLGLSPAGTRVPWREV